MLFLSFVNGSELRGFLAMLGGKSQGFSALETSWRRRQSAANSSPGLEFPANREKYREFCRIPPP
jgi:hypothetical protein